MAKLKNLTRDMVAKFLDEIIENGKEIPFKRRSVKHHLIYKCMRLRQLSFKDYEGIKHSRLLLGWHLLVPSDWKVK